MALTTPTYPGINLDANDGPATNAVAIASIFLSRVTLILRFTSRLRTQVTFGLDDWLIVVAAFLSWGFTATVIVQVEHNYFGQHIGKTDPYQVEEFNKGLYGVAIVYPLALTFSKLSLLALYWRIFRVTSARRPLQIAAALNVAWMTAAFLVGIFSCTPVQGFWDATIKSRCIQYPQFFTSNEGFTIVLDLFVLLMPVYFISQLQQSLSHRISISSTFLLGLVVTVASAVRLWQLVLAQRKPGYDPTFNQTTTALWAIVELNLWIIVASIPALRPLISKTIQDFRAHRAHNNASPSRIPKASFVSTKPLKIGRHWPSLSSSFYKNGTDLFVQSIDQSLPRTPPPPIPLQTLKSTYAVPKVVPALASASAPSILYDFNSNENRVYDAAAKKTENRNSILPWTPLGVPAAISTSNNDNGDGNASKASERPGEMISRALTPVLPSPSSSSSSSSSSPPSHFE